MKNPSRTGFSLSVFVPHEMKHPGCPTNLRASIDLRRFCRGRLQAGTVRASGCSPEGERYNARRISQPNGDAL
jgi:hypothetical protein